MLSMGVKSPQSTVSLYREPGQWLFAPVLHAVFAVLRLHLVTRTFLSQSICSIECESSA